MSRTRPAWTATSRAPCWPPPASARAPGTPLISLLALNGLHVSEATGADIEATGPERRHRTMVITRKGGKAVTIPLAPRTARAIGLAIGERTEGPIFVAADRRRLDRHGAARTVRRAEIVANWERARKSEPLLSIPPLP
jgi:integrase